MLQQLLAILWSCLEIPINVFDQNNRGVDDDAEIYRAHRQEIRVLVPHNEDYDAEEQCERNIRAHDDGAAQITEKDPLNEEDQQTTEEKVVQDRTCGDRHQRSAVIEGNEPHSGRQAPIAVDFFHFRLDPPCNVARVQCAVHDHDRRHHIVLFVTTSLTESWDTADINLRNILHLHGNTFRLPKHGVLDVFDLPPIDQAGVAAVVKQTDAADVHRLLADIDRAPAHIVVGIADGADHLG